jgi:hypothetical protein
MQADEINLLSIAFTYANGPPELTPRTRARPHEAHRPSAPGHLGDAGGASGTGRLQWLLDAAAVAAVSII